MSRAARTTDALAMATRTLKMPGLLRAHQELCRQARDERWGYEDFLQRALDAELTSRSASVVAARLRAARFPERKTIDDFDFQATDGVITAQMIADLARGAWIDSGHNVVFAGPIGTGKTHLGIALGIEATRRKKRVLFTRAADLVRTLVEARDARDLGRMQKRLLRVDLLIVDELGFVPFDRVGGELLFNVLAERYERKSVLVTTNLAFAEWPRVFGGDEKLTTALLDRLAHHATVIVTRGRSYRMRTKGGESTAAETPPKVAKGEKSA